MATLEEQVMAQMKDAMKSKDEALLRGLRAIKAEIIKAKTDPGAGGSITTEGELKLLQKLVKSRKDSLTIYQEQNRADLEKDELEQLKHLEVYLPQQLSKEEVLVIINEIISNLDASKISDMGKVMAVATKELSGKADGKLIASFVRERLQ